MTFVRNKFVAVLVRGATGGALGGLIWLTLSMWQETPTRRTFFWSAFALMVPLTAGLGLAVTVAVVALRFMMGKRFGVPLWIAITVLMTIVVWGLVLWLRGEFVSDTLKTGAAYLAVFGIIVGTTTALLVGDAQQIVGPERGSRVL